jgi:hypothetical protein
LLLQNSRPAAIVTVSTKEVLVTVILPNDRMSSDVKASVKLLLRVGGETPVFVFGDTVIGRVCCRGAPSA